MMRNYREAVPVFCKGKPSRDLAILGGSCGTNRRDIEALAKGIQA